MHLLLSAFVLYLAHLPFLGSVEQPNENEGAAPPWPFFCASRPALSLQQGWLPLRYHPSYECPGADSIAYQYIVSLHSPAIDHLYPKHDSIAIDRPLAEYERLLRTYWQGNEKVFTKTMNYRSNWDYLQHHPEKDRFVGWDAYYSSMSRQFSRLEFDALFLHHLAFALSLRDKEHQSKSVKLYFIDLRLESHGFVNGLPMYFRCAYNWALEGCTPQAAALDEGWRLQDLRTACAPASSLLLDTRRDDSGQRRREKRNKSLTVAPPLHVHAEKDMIDHYQKQLKEAGLAAHLSTEYLRWRVLDHAGPDPSLLDEFIRLVKSHRRSGPHANTIPVFHFHCLAGKGRTTTFSSLLDILYNAPKGVSLALIRARQISLNAYRLKRHRKRKDQRDTPSDRAIHKRYLLISLFYDYVYENNPLENDDCVTFETYALAKDE